MTRRLNITLPDATVQEADAFAKANRFSRSGLIRAALEHFVSGGPEHDLAEEVRAPYAPTAPSRTPTLERIAPLLRAFFAAQDEVATAWLFGSAARDVAGPLSDVDVAVLPSDPAMSRTERVRLCLDAAGRLEGVLGVPKVDVVALPDASALLGHRIVTTGVRVFGEDRHEAAEAEIRALRAFWDFRRVFELSDDLLTERMERYARL